MSHKRAICIFLAVALALSLTACAGDAPAPDEPSAPPAESASPETSEPPDGTGTAIDFANGKYDFLFVHRASPDAARAELSLIDYNGGKAVRVDNSAGGTPYIVIDARGILGENAPLLHTMEALIGVEDTGGEFYAVSGELAHVSQVSSQTPMSAAWSVYLPTKNPNVARAELDGRTLGREDFFILSKTVDNALDAGEAPRNLIISEIRFFDAAGKPLPVNPDAVFDAPEGFGEPDVSNLTPVTDETPIADASGTSNGWGQAVALATVKNGGAFDPALLAPDSVVTVYYTAETPPELILQSWTEGAPESAGWAKVAPAAVNDTGTAAQFIYADLAAAFGTADFAPFLDQIFVGDTGGELKVYAVTVGRAG
ncbi:MAG: hypothetical protein LBT12_03015 [Oscillospiraceae bacterium]|jgi:hypothetical protein|nr:hypothetical protein [Oscillospiraceae bacterium]